MTKIKPIAVSVKKTDLNSKTTYNCVLCDKPYSDTSGAYKHYVRQHTSQFEQQKSFLSGNTSKINASKFDASVSDISLDVSLSASEQGLEDIIGVTSSLKPSLGVLKPQERHTAMHPQTIRVANPTLQKKARPAKIARPAKTKRPAKTTRLAKTTRPAKTMRPKATRHSVQHAADTKTVGQPVAASIYDPKRLARQENGDIPNEQLSQSLSSSSSVSLNLEAESDFESDFESDSEESKLEQELLGSEPEPESDSPVDTMYFRNLKDSIEVSDEDSSDDSSEDISGDVIDGDKLKAKGSKKKPKTFKTPRKITKNDHHSEKLIRALRNLMTRNFLEDPEVIKKSTLDYIKDKSVFYNKFGENKLKLQKQKTEMYKKMYNSCFKRFVCTVTKLEIANRKVSFLAAKLQNKKEKEVCVVSPSNSVVCKPETQKQIQDRRKVMRILRLLRLKREQKRQPLWAQRLKPTITQNFEWQIKNQGVPEASDFQQLHMQNLMSQIEQETQHVSQETQTNVSIFEYPRQFLSIENQNQFKYPTLFPTALMQTRKNVGQKNNGSVPLWFAWDWYGWQRRAAFSLGAKKITIQRDDANNDMFYGPHYVPVPLWGGLPLLPISLCVQEYFDELVGHVRKEQHYMYARATHYTTQKTTSRPGKEFYQKALSLFATTPRLQSCHIKVRNFEEIKGRLVAAYNLEDSNRGPQSRFFRSDKAAIHVICVEELCEKLNKLNQNDSIITEKKH